MPVVLVAGTNCYAELAVPSPAMVVAIANTHFAYHGGMARLSWPGWLGRLRRWHTCERSSVSLLTQLNVEQLVHATNGVTMRLSHYTLAFT